VSEAPKVIKLELCAPQRELIELDVAEVVVPGAAGVFTVQYDHTPLLTTLTQGTLIAYGMDKSKRFVAVNGGFAEVRDNRVVVLTDTMESADKIDVKRAESARDRAESRIRKPSEDTDVARAEVALRRALARIRTAERIEY